MAEVIDLEMTAIITGAAGNVVAYLLNGQVDTVRGWFSRIFNNHERAEPLRVLNDDATALLRRQLSEADAKARWTVLLASYFATHPEARAALEDLASSAPRQPGVMFVGTQRNESSGVFIGRDMHGDVSSPGPAE